LAWENSGDEKPAAVNEYKRSGQDDEKKPAAKPATIDNTTWSDSDAVEFDSFYLQKALWKEIVDLKACGGKVTARCKRADDFFLSWREEAGPRPILEVCAIKLCVGKDEAGNDTTAVVEFVNGTVDDTKGSCFEEEGAHGLVVVVVPTEEFVGVDMSIMDFKVECHQWKNDTRTHNLGGILQVLKGNDYRFPPVLMFPVDEIGNCIRESASFGALKGRNLRNSIAIVHDQGRDHAIFLEEKFSEDGDFDNKFARLDDRSGPQTTGSMIEQILGLKSSLQIKVKGAGEKEMLLSFRTHNVSYCRDVYSNAASALFDVDGINDICFSGNISRGMGTLPIGVDCLKHVCGVEKKQSFSLKTVSLEKFVVDLPLQEIMAQSQHRLLFDRCSLPDDGQDLLNPREEHRLYLSFVGTHPPLQELHSALKRNVIATLHLKDVFLDKKSAKILAILVESSMLPVVLNPDETDDGFILQDVTVGDERLVSLLS
jgi:hypothetical protein